MEKSREKEPGEFWLGKIKGCTRRLALNKGYAKDRDCFINIKPLSNFIQTRLRERLYMVKLYLILTL